MQSSAQGARFLFFTQLAMLVMSALDLACFDLIAPRLGIEQLQRAVSVSEAIWALASLGQLAAIAVFTFERPADERGYGFFALAASAVLTAWFAWSLFFPRSGHDEQFLRAEHLRHAVISVVILALNLSLWFAAARAAGGVSPAWTAAYVLLCGTGTLMALGFAFAPDGWQGRLGPLAMTLMSWFRTALSFSHEGVLLWVLWRAGFAVPQGTTPGANAPAPSATRDFVVGGIWLAGGVLVTLGSFAAASSGGGGRYVITTGAIAYGIGRLIRGLARSGGTDRATR